MTDSPVAPPYQAPAWQPIETAPKEGTFLVYHGGASGLRMMVADGYLLALSQVRETPRYLSGHHWTHWMPLPAALVVRVGKMRRI